MTRRAIMLAVGGVAVAALEVRVRAPRRATRPTTDRRQGLGHDLGGRRHQRVPKPTAKVTNADGSWREETRQGSCVTIKEGTRDGSVKTTRKCD